jgi:hypothetical protein
MLAVDKLQGKKCKACGFLQTDPAYGCIKCGSMELDHYEFSGLGEIYTFTVVYVGFGHMAEKAPYVLAIVDLKEGAKTTTILEDITDVESAKIGMKVQFKRIDEKIGPIFKPI